MEDIVAFLYPSQFSEAVTPQSQSVPGTAQIPNSAGGYTFEVDDWARLDRFLILGTEGPTYYSIAEKLTVENAQAAMRCIQSDGVRAVARIAEISDAGRAPKNDAAIFVLAMAARKGNLETRRAAFSAIPEVCRTGTHLFLFHEALKAFPGRSSGLNRAIGRWYTDKPVDVLAYQLVKYRQRNGWTHRDVLRLAKPAAGNVPALKWAVGKPADSALPAVIEGFIKAQEAKTAKEAVAVLRDYPSLPWEALPTEHLAHGEVWEALLPNLPVMATVRNLGRLTAKGLLGPVSAAVKTVTARLTDSETIRKSRIHPISILGAMGIYGQGRGDKGSMTWVPSARIVDALDAAFYMAFDNVETTGKRTLIALDVSGSMDGGLIAAMPGITPMVASAAIAMVIARREPSHAFIAFTSSGVRGAYGGKWGGGDAGVTVLDISPRQRLNDVCRQMKALPMGGTDCSLPMVWAAREKVAVDTFIVTTDNETWAGDIHPSQALKKYRKDRGIASKLVVAAMTPTPFSIADPADGGMLDIVGMDTAVPSLIRDFSVS